MELLYFQYHYSSYTKLPFPPHLPRKPPSVLRGVRMGPTTTTLTCNKKKDKVLVLVGATGCGKSSLSVDLASHFGGCEIINSDKMQVYKGLDITTNKIPLADRKGIIHHHLGDFDPTLQPLPELSPSAFRLSAGSTISDITSRGNLPIVAGGSNSFVHALLVENFDPTVDFFDGSSSDPTRLRYDCCFLWVDVAFPVLCDYLCKRVDEMLDSGMFEELERFFGDLLGSGFDSGSRGCFERGVGIMKAIGVPEFEGYFRKYKPGVGPGREGWDRRRSDAYEEAVREIKENTCRLARRQIGKIVRLRDVAGWDLRKVNATASLQLKMVGGESDSHGRKWVGVWEKEVVEPSMEIVRRFLEE